MSARRGFVLLNQCTLNVLRYQALRTISSHFSTVSGISRYSHLLYSGNTLSARIHSEAFQSRVKNLISTTDEPDTLYKKIEVLAKCHDKTVLDSYEYFAVLAAKELGINVEKVHEPKRKIERFTLLKSVHIFKKHRAQYEMRTHYRCFELKHLTGSTADVYLEYIQRNLPEGVALEITKTTLEKLPDHVRYPVWDTLPEDENTKSS
ncbi:28S ribosomal protein S10, mitochondrial [Xenopus laevis]|uniref:Small ribosomal subunit protein uS10m n=2 Tax=Xenopus laevis TaxID=8355 RepID=A0A974C395_XENLA|nr:28S ribosomal protein S10, mitochondrial [Xenopus laevis]OCT65085.1 hypothetical protein XELAEV_18041327mg [Xenopus laevis]